MPVSEARQAAARANGARSRGPVSEAGKAISRRNAIQHGLAAEVLVPAEDSAEVARRSLAMQAEMGPKTEMGRYLVQRLAELTVRVERCSKQERGAIEHRAGHAASAFDEARLAEVDHALARIGEEPATHARKLRSMPEGIDRMIAALLELREELNTGRWDNRHGERVAHLTGARFLDVPVTRVRALSEAISGDFGLLRAGDGAGLSDPDRIDWARNAMADRIDLELERLLEDREGLDLEAIAADRAGAAGRSGLDPSKEAVLARRYEASAERGVFRTLAELRRVEAEAASRTEEEVCESLGSSCAGDLAGPGPAAPTEVPGPPKVDRPQDPARRGSDPVAPTAWMSLGGVSEVPITIGRVGSGRA